MATPSNYTENVAVVTSRTSLRLQPQTHGRTSGAVSMSTASHDTPGSQLNLIEPRCEIVSDRGSSTSPERTRTGRIKVAKKGLRVHTCEYCHKTYTRNEHLKRHRNTHLPRKYPCPKEDCDKSFHREDLLRRHEEKQHQSPTLGNVRTTLSRTQSSPDLHVMPRGLGISIDPPSRRPSLLLTENHTEDGGNTFDLGQAQPYTTYAHINPRSRTASATPSNSSIGLPDQSLFPPQYGTPFTTGVINEYDRSYFPEFPFGSCGNTTSAINWPGEQRPLYLTPMHTPYTSPPSEYTYPSPSRL